MPLFKCSASKAKPKNGIRYITDQNKAAFVSAKNLFEDEDYAKQFEETAKRFGKGEKFDERKYYHFKLSCARKDNVTPRRAHDFAEEVAEAFFKNYECVIATHTDTETVHSHIIVNAVDPITGEKLQFGKAEYAAMKDEVNRIGKEHGYTETDFRKRSKNSRTPIEKKIILKGGTSWKEELREVIAEGIKNSKTAEEFKEYQKQVVKNAAAMAAKLEELCRAPEVMQVVGENAQRELYVSWETAVQRAMARYEVVIDNYRSGKYPKRERFGDEFFKTQGGLMEAFASVGELSEEIAAGLRIERDEALQTIVRSRQELRGRFGETKQELTERYETILQKVDRYL